jgi:hypothetical protein
LLRFRPRHQAGKINGPLVIAGRVGAFDIAKFTLETVVDNFDNVFNLQLLGVDISVFALDAVIVDGVEQPRKTAAELNAHAAVGAQAKNAFRFGAQILLVIISRVRGIIGGVMAHRMTPSLMAVKLCQKLYRS